MSKVGLIQMTSGANPKDNLAFIERHLASMVEQGVDWVVLPENALVFGRKQDYQQHAEPLGDGPLQMALAHLAQRYQVWLFVGSFPIQAQDKIRASCLVFSSQGELCAHYDKLHLFDVTVEDEHKSYRESDTFAAGQQVVTVPTPFGQIGLSICYDIRFPALFSQLAQQGADIIFVPAAFTYVTGQAHWEVLLRARAIETQSWVVAVGQTGVHPCGRKTWGHSMVIDPWGRIQAFLSETKDHLIVTIDTQMNHDIRTQMPVLQHARFSQQLENK